MFNLFIASLTFNYMFENVLPGTTLGSALFASGICANKQIRMKHHRGQRTESTLWILTFQFYCRKKAVRVGRYFFKEMLRALDWPTLEARREAARLTTTLYKIDSGDVKIKSANLHNLPHQASRSRQTHDKQLSDTSATKTFV